MSERMTDEEFDRKMDEEERKSMAGAARFAWREANRARASEAEEDAEIAKKDSQIKALADALERHGWACRVTLGQPRPDCGCVGCQSATALRLAGRPL